MEWIRKKVTRSTFNVYKSVTPVPCARCVHFINQNDSDKVPQILLCCKILEKTNETMMKKMIFFDMGCGYTGANAVSSTPRCFPDIF